jgi:hypothetical protein
VQKHYHEVELATDVLQVIAASIEALRCGFVNGMDDEGISTGLEPALCISMGRISCNRDVVSMAGFIFRIGFFNGMDGEAISTWLGLALCRRGGIRRGDVCGFITAFELFGDELRIGFVKGMDDESISTWLELALCISRGRISCNEDAVSMAGFFLGFFTVEPDDISTTELDVISKCWNMLGFLFLYCSTLVNNAFLVEPAELLWTPTSSEDSFRSGFRIGIVE